MLSTFVFEGTDLTGEYEPFSLPDQRCVFDTYSDFLVVHTVHLRDQQCFFHTYIPFGVVRTVHLRYQRSF